MKGSFIMFFIFILVAYCGISIYILTRSYQSLEAIGNIRWAVVGFLIVMAAGFMLMLMFKRRYDNAALDILWTMSAYWAAVILYVSLVLLSIDIVRLICRLAWQSPVVLLGANYAMAKLCLFGAVAAGLVITLSVGTYRAFHPVVNTVDITIEKAVPGRDSLNIVLLSDLHLGSINGRNALSRWVDEVNALQPDIILIAGDVYDDNPAPVERQQLGNLLEQLKAPLGVYFAQGNHDGYGDFSRAVQYLQAHGVTVLSDTVVPVDNSFYVAGRLDRNAGMGNRMNKTRKTVEALTEGLDKSKPLILLDHQPYELEKAEAAGVDLQLSGHTHRGQLWPFSLVVNSMYEIDHGYLQKGKAHFYVSQGVGTWGPPVRIGSRSEIVRLKVEFMQK